MSSTHACRSFNLASSEGRKTTCQAHHNPGGSSPDRARRHQPCGGHPSPGASPTAPAVSGRGRVDDQEYKWHNHGMAITAVAVERRASAKSRSAVQKALSYLQGLGCETMTLMDSARADVAKWSGADVVLVDSTGSRLVVEVKRLHQEFPQARVFVATDCLTTASLSEAYRAGAALVAPPAGFVDAVRNVIRVTIGDPVVVSDRARLEVGDASRHPLEEAVVGEFHDAVSGRLDARRVADAYHLSLSALAKALRITQSALSKRPTALAAQPALRELEVAWATLLAALGRPEKVRAWLNVSRRDLGGEPPIKLLLDGSAKSFANYVRSAVAGEPG